MKYTQVELPSLHLLWKRDNGEEIVSSVIRTNYPKPSLYFIPAIVKQTGLCEVETIDMKIRDQDKITPYKKFRYGDGEMIASRKGMLFQKLESKLKQTDILGISINPTSWSNIAIDFMRYAKSVNPNMKIIIGGNEAIFRADHYLKEGLADIAIFGEAENSLPEIIRAIKDGSSLNGINGIKYISDEGVKTTGFAARVILDEIPLPYLDVLKEDMHLWTTPIECFPLPDGVSTPMVWMFITRGCMQFCNYCTVPAKHGVKKFRFKSLQRVEKELDYVKAYGVSTINIWDDSLSSVMYDSVLGKKEGRKYLISLARMLKEKGFAYEFSQGMVIRDLWDGDTDQPDYELINELYSHEIVDGKYIGCYGEYFPTECLQEENPHERYDKLMTFDKEKKVLEAILYAGTKRITYSSIIGTMEDTQKGFDLATERSKEIDALVKSKGGMSLMTPFIHSIFPGTLNWRSYKENMVYSIEEFPELYQLNAAPHSINNFKPHEITLAKKEMEKIVMTSEQLNRWNTTGRYSWANTP